jgi:hypothetical protein
MKHFEMAHEDNPEEMIEASKNAVITAMQNLLKDMRKDVKQPGLTWDQIDFFFEEFKKKKAEIVRQEFES